jgi:hypothetical protein
MDRKDTDVLPRVGADGQKLPVLATGHAKSRIRWREVPQIEPGSAVVRQWLTGPRDRDSAFTFGGALR